MRKFWVGLLALTVSMTLFAERVSVDDAALVANHFMNAASANTNVKKAVPAKKMVRKATATEDLYYLYENENGEGWVLVSVNDAMTPILAYSETGHFRTDNMPSNLKKWLSKYNDFTRKIEADGVVAGEETQNEWKALRKGARKATAAVVVGPLVKTTWDQDAPYWNLCPGQESKNTKAYTGCVATAMAQVMNYWQWPEQGTGSRTYQPQDPNSNTGAKSKRYGQQTANFGATTYDWAHMKNSYSGSYTETEATAVATLMYHCGVATDMMYGNDADGGSGTYTVNYGDWDWSDSEGECAQNALYKFFGYKKPTGYMRDGYTYNRTKYYDAWSDADWTAMIKAELDLQHPIMYAGAGDGGGHSFICDGYRTDNYFHFNWGWSGSNDGYYKLSNLAPGSGGAGGGDYSFSENQDVIIGIVPDREEPEVLPTVHITWAVNGVAGTPVEMNAGDLITLPADPTCDCGKVFVGWTEQISIINGERPSDLFTTNEGKKATSDKTYYAVFADQEGEGGAPVNDVLTRETTGVTSTTYTEWSGKTCASSAVYAGMSAGGHESIQLRTKNKNEGIIMTQSGGNVTKITIDWNENTSADRKLDIYGKNTAYSSVSDLYGDKQGTKLGQLAYGETELNLNGDYQFIGIRSNTSALYLTSIVISWGGGTVHSNFSMNCCATEGISNTRVADKAVKVMENGQIVILRDNKKYSIFGQRIQ